MKEEQDEEDKVSTDRPSSHVSIETVLYEDYIQQKKNGGGEEMCNKRGMSQQEEEVEDSLWEIENGEMMMDIDEEEEGRRRMEMGLLMGRLMERWMEIKAVKKIKTPKLTITMKVMMTSKVMKRRTTMMMNLVRQSARNVQPDPSLPATSNDTQVKQFTTVALQNASNSNESIEESGANLSSEQQTLTNLNEPNEVTRVTQSAHLLSPSTSTGNGSNRTALNQQATVPTQHNKRKQPTSKRSSKRSKKTIEENEGEDGEDGENGEDDDSVNEDREEGKVKVLHLNYHTQLFQPVIFPLTTSIVTLTQSSSSSAHHVNEPQCDEPTEQRQDTSVGDERKVQVPSQNFMKRIEPADELGNRFGCDYRGCGKRMKLRSNLISHIQSHTGEKPFKCSVEGCDRAFIKDAQLKEHLNVHSGSRPFVCTWPGCEAGFASKANLTAHLRTHTGERSFKCDQCDATFTQHGNLVTHRRTHTGERPFHCDQCDAAYTQIAHLATHLRTHTGSRPFVCTWPECGQAFIQSSHLKTHSIVHSNERKFSCDVTGCGKAFKGSSGLWKHQKAKHN